MRVRTILAFFVLATTPLTQAFRGGMLGTVSDTE
jgi:hypothetical protein